MYRKIIALGLSGALLAGLMTGAIYAKDEQSVYSQTGYRLYVDEISETSGTIYSDISQVTEDYDIIEVKMPDGQTVDPENVKYTVDASGDYSFEISYKNDTESNTESTENIVSKVNATSEESQINQEDIIQIEQPLPQEFVNEIEKPLVKEEISKEQDDVEKMEASKQSELLKETLTVNVELLQSESKTDSSQVQIQDQIKKESVSQSNHNQLSDESVVENRATRANFGNGYDKYNSKKTWTQTDFNSRWTTMSNKHMNWGNDPTGVHFNPQVANSFDDEKGALFRFGAKLSRGIGEEYWLQQGAVFSNILFDLNKDFALIGSLRIGNLFGAGESAYNSRDLKADGGVTISFIPESEVQNAKDQALTARSSGYRLGAYGTLPNSIVCEMDTSSTDYYFLNDNGNRDWRTFGISDTEMHDTGDYKYASSGNAIPSMNEKDIYQTSLYSGEHYQNVQHIGISTTGSDMKAKVNSDRVITSTKRATTYDYEITYTANTKMITFKVQDDGGIFRETSLNITNLYNQLQNKKMKLAFTSGIAYLSLDRFNSNQFFNGTKKQVGDGQIDIWARELYVTPDLERTDTKVRWLENGTLAPPDNKQTVAYYNDNLPYVYNNKSLWPVAGDRIYPQFAFVPTSDIMPQPESVNDGSLTFETDELAIVDDSGKPIPNLNLNKPTIYYRKGDTGNFQKYTEAIKIGPTDLNKKIYVRLELNLPKVSSDSTIEKYNVSGKVIAKYSVGKSKVTYNVHIMNQNGNKMPVSRPPKFIGWNGTDYYNSIRVISSKNNIDSSLRFTSNQGSKNGSDGRQKSIHYGVGYKLFSVDGEYYIYQDRNNNKNYDIKKFNYKTATMSNLKDIKTVEPVNDSTENLKLDFSEDRRFILEYKLQDPNYMKTDAEKLTGNPDRGKATGKRVIWASDNVEVSNGYEFFAKNVVMSKDDFKGFATMSDKGEYYRKIAKEAGVKIFKTSNYDFDDLINGNYTAASGLSGIGNHDGVNNALQNPGKPYDVTLQYKDSNGTISTRTIKLTIQEDSPKVMSIDGKIADQPSEKIIFNGENFTVSGTFKLMKDDGSIVDYDTFDDKANIKVALYKKNPSNKNKGDKFYRWSNRTQADTDGQDMSSSGRIDKLQVPATITDNKDGTFTVIFKLYNHQNGNDSGSQNWITKEWDHLSQYRIYCWTDKNGQNIKYSQLDDTGTDSVEINHVGNTAQVPSATTTMRMIEKENGNLPTSMFKISNIILNDDGTELSDKRNTTTVGLKSLDGLTEEELNKADHDYYYEIHVNESNTDNQQRPYVTLTQSDTQKSFNATYLTYDSNKKSYTNITKTNTLLGSIAYPSNKNSLPQSIRFGMRADRQTGITSNTKFMGTANFKFVRKSLQEVANP